MEPANGCSAGCCLTLWRLGGVRSLDTVGVVALAAGGRYQCSGWEFKHKRRHRAEKKSFNKINVMFVQETHSEDFNEAYWCSRWGGGRGQGKKLTRLNRSRLGGTSRYQGGDHGVNDEQAGVDNEGRSGSGVPCSPNGGESEQTRHRSGVGEGKHPGLLTGRWFLSPGGVQFRGGVFSSQQLVCSSQCVEVSDRAVLWDAPCPWNPPPQATLLCSRSGCTGF